MPKAIPLAPKLTVKDGKAFTTSLEVSAFFRKNHDIVLRAIDNLLLLINELDPEIGRCNFAASSYQNEQKKTQRLFQMTRTGFSLIALGFTGKKPLAFKLGYIKAFDDMEAEIQRLEAEKTADPFGLTPLGGGATVGEVKGLLTDFWRANRSASQSDLDRNSEHLQDQILDSVRKMLSESEGKIISGAIGGTKRALQNEELWKASGFVPKPIEDDSRTTFVTTTQVCWRVIKRDKLHHNVPKIVGKRLMQSARKFHWRQGVTDDRSYTDRPAPTFPLDKVRQWLLDGGADIIRKENESQIKASRGELCQTSSTNSEHPSATPSSTNSARPAN